MSQGQTDLTNRETNISVVIQTITDSISKEIEQLSRLYVIRDPERVLAFYAENRFLFDLLLEIPTQIKKYFGQDVELILRLSQEPEFPSARELVVEIKSGLSVKEEISLLDKFDEEWWLDNSGKADCKLNIMLR
jgi:hypothetical protein